MSNTIQDELKRICEGAMVSMGFDGTYVFNNWAEGNISADKVTRTRATPLVMSVLPAAGSFIYDLHGRREVQDVMLLFVDRARQAPTTEIMAPTIEQMKALAKMAIDLVAVSDVITFDTGSSDIVTLNYKTVIPSKMDAGLVGISIEIRVAEKQSTAYGCR